MTLLSGCGFLNDIGAWISQSTYQSMLIALSLTLSLSLSLSHTHTRARMRAHIDWKPAYHSC